MKRILLIALIPPLALLAACRPAEQTESATPDEQTTQAAPDDGEQLRLSGSFFYLPRIALPPDSELTVALHAGAAPEAQALVELHVGLGGRQVPLDFQIAVDSDRLQAGIVHSVHGAIRAQGRTLWVSEPVVIEAGSGEAKLGQIPMHPYPAMAFPTRLRCGEVVITAGYDDERMRLAADDREWSLRTVRSASGARYEAEDDPDTWFWSKGQGALVSIDGETLSECQPLAADDDAFHARGNEPGWHLEMGAETLVLVLDYGASRLTAATPPAMSADDGSRVYAVQEGARAFTVHVAEALCQDTMTGMPYPYHVRVDIEATILHGCGGQPASLLVGDRWQVTRIADQTVPDDMPATIQFHADGRFDGHAPCNSYSGQYTLTGEGLELSSPTATLMACGEDHMRLEEALFEVLPEVYRFDITDRGELGLHAYRQAITARR